MRLRAIVLTLLVCGLFVAEMRPASKVGRRDLDAVERSIDRRFQTVDQLARMKVLWRSRGAYLEGFGVVFTLELNLVPMANVSPFQRSYTEEQKRKLNGQKREKLKVLERTMREILLEEGSKLGAVPDKEKVALVVTLFHYRWEDLTDLPSQLVVQATRQSLLDVVAGRLSSSEFRDQTEVKYF